MKLCDVLYSMSQTQAGAKPDGVYLVPSSRNSKTVYHLTGGFLSHQLIHLAGSNTVGCEACEVFLLFYELAPSQLQWEEEADSHHQTPTTYASDHASTVRAQSRGKTSRLGAKVRSRTESQWWVRKHRETRDPARWFPRPASDSVSLEPRSK